ncbi:MAG: hypothetical protein WA555_09590 [Candidatus Sulfotelmatobacter sp.]
MPPITALLHTMNDGLRLARALEMLLPCAELLIVDHDSGDGTRRIAREYGARMVAADGRVRENHYLDLARHEWIFCMEPRESISESLQASLFEWSTHPSESMSGGAFSVFLREQIGESWVRTPRPETRLIPRSWSLWEGRMPAFSASAIALEGDLLRFALP